MLPLILLVDNNVERLAFLADTLKARYSVLKSDDGQKALDLLDKLPVELVISDVPMLVMDGFELCRRIKSTVDHAHIPVLLLATKSALWAGSTGLGLGADAYLERPFSPEILLAQITSLLYNRNKMKEFFAISPLAFIPDQVRSRSEGQFLRQLTVIIVANMENPLLNVEMLARKMAVSRITLYRKIKALADLTPAELINRSRLRKAAQLLAGGRLRVYEVSGSVGFSSPGNFTRNFTRLFQMTPTEYAHSRQTQG